MDRSTVVQALLSGEKDRAIIRITTAGRRTPITGAVQKVMNQIVIFRPVDAGPMTLALGDIQSVAWPPSVPLLGRLSGVVKGLFQYRVRIFQKGAVAPGAHPAKSRMG